MDDPIRQRFRYEVGAGSSFDAMGRKYFELRVILCVVATMRDQKDLAMSRGICEPPDIGKYFFRARDVEFSSRQHEIGLCVDFPENYVARYHTVRQLCAKQLTTFEYTAEFRTAEVKGVYGAR